MQIPVRKTVQEQTSTYSCLRTLWRYELIVAEVIQVMDFSMIKHQIWKQDAFDAQAFDAEFDFLCQNMKLKMNVI